MRNLMFAGWLMVFLAILPAAAFEVELEERFINPAAAVTVKILSSTDLERFRPIISSFLARHPRLSVHYVVASTAEIYNAIAEEKQPFDIVISSAMDLQMKLANDGHTRQYHSAQTEKSPRWSKWRTQIYGFALEPVVSLISKKDFDRLARPKTRRDLLALMRDNPAIFFGRLATYDPHLSGAGYLFATQDTRQSDTFWRLAEVMGRLKAKLYCCTKQMIDAVESGEIAMAYNILGSYANAILSPSGNAQIVALQDYTQILLRTAVIPVSAPNPKQGGRFLDYLLSAEGQEILDRKSQLPALDNQQIGQMVNGKPIRLDSGLLVYLDRVKRTRFLAEWNSALMQE